MKSDIGIVLSHEVDEEGVLSEESKVRVEEGLKLFNRGVFNELVMSGGYLKGSNFSIASRMKDYARQQGFTEDISTEEISLDTVGQLIFLKEGIIDPRGIKDITFVTHYWHAAKTEFMAYSFFDESYNIQVIGLEPRRYNEKRRWDFEKIPLFINSFPLDDIRSSNSLVRLLTDRHPWYNGEYPFKKFDAQYFVKRLEVLKGENSR